MKLKFIYLCSTESYLKITRRQTVLLSCHFPVSHDLRLSSNHVAFLCHMTSDCEGAREGGGGGGGGVRRSGANRPARATGTVPTELRHLWVRQSHDLLAGSHDSILWAHIYGIYN